MEQRLIDANALDDSFRHSIVKCKQWFEDAAVLGEEESKARADQAYVTFMECSMRLKKQPTVDAVPVVRCEDCKHYKDGFCYNPNTYDDEKTCGNTTKDWFCADGERKDGEYEER